RAGSWWRRPPRSPRDGETRTGCCDRRGAHPTDSTGAPGGAREGPADPSRALLALERRAGDDEVERQVLRVPRGVGRPHEDRRLVPGEGHDADLADRRDAREPRRPDRGLVGALADAALEEHGVPARGAWTTFVDATPSPRLSAPFLPTTAKSTWALARVGAAATFAV